MYYYSYGIKEVNGVHHLSGVGLPTYDTPGVIAGGGKWPSRFVHAIMQCIYECHIII